MEGSVVDLALSVDDKFCEVPFDAFAQWSRCLAFDPVVRGGDLFAIVPWLWDRGKGGLVVEATEFIDFLCSS